MSEDPANDPQNTPEENGKGSSRDPTPSPAQNSDVPGSWEEIFQHPRFKELNEAKKTAEQKLAELQEERKKQREQELEEQEKWKELAEQREQELEAERLERLRLTVAAQVGLPADMAARLQGQTEEELKEDAERLKEFVKPTTPGVPPAGGKGGSPPEITLKQLNDPAWVRENAAKIREAAAAGTLPERE